jgi:hypothetical protein
LEQYKTLEQALKIQFILQIDSQRIALASLEIRFENTFNKKTLKLAYKFNSCSQIDSQRIALASLEIRFENTFNKKTLKLAWRFFVESIYS